MRQLLIAVALVWLMPTHASAQKTTVGEAVFDFDDPAGRPQAGAQQQFVARYLAAIKAKDAVALLALVHPLSLDCIKSNLQKIYLAELHARDLRREIPDDAKIIFVPFTAAMRHPFGPADIATLPIDPTDMLGIDYQWAERDANGVLLKHRGVTVVRMIARDGDTLKLVDYCLTPKGEELFAKKRASTPPAPASPPR
jgi:hypothetical protein